MKAVKIFILILRISLAIILVFSTKRLKVAFKKQSLMLISSKLNFLKCCRNQNIELYSYVQRFSWTICGSKIQNKIRVKRQDAISDLEILMT